MRTRPLSVALWVLAFAAIGFSSSSVAQQTGCGDPPKSKKLCKDCGPNASFFRPWLQEDVPWIITSEERAVFLKLNNDEERENFIDIFWLRRDPTPDTIENEFRNEHYRRIAYANQHFSTDRPGWHSDRGHIYILYGPPDEITTGNEEFAAESKSSRNSESCPVETWRYRYVDGIGQDVRVKFVDACRCWDYRLSVGAGGKDAHLYSPRHDSPRKADGDQIVQVLAGIKWPATRYKYLEEVVTHSYSFREFPFQIRTDFVKLTNASGLVPLTIQFANKDVTWKTENGKRNMRVEVYGRVMGLTGRIVQTFEDTISDEIPEDEWASISAKTRTYTRSLALPLARFRIDIAAKDVYGDRVGTAGAPILNGMQDGLSSLQASSLILADGVRTSSARNTEPGKLLVGDSEISLLPGVGNPPKTNVSSNQTLNAWMQVYGLQTEPNTRKPMFQVDYEIVNLANKAGVKKDHQDQNDFKTAGEQVTALRSLSPSELPKGDYRLTVTVRDDLSKLCVQREALFQVVP